MKTLYIKIVPKMLSLADVIRKKDLIDAVQCGWILHLPDGFHDQLNQVPKRCHGLKSAPKELIDLFDLSFKGANIYLAPIY
jgi:hypothetical protein